MKNCVKFFASKNVHSGSYLLIKGCHRDLAGSVLIASSHLLPHSLKFFSVLVRITTTPKLFAYFNRLQLLIWRFL